MHIHQLSIVIAKGIVNSQEGDGDGIRSIAILESILGSIS